MPTVVKTIGSGGGRDYSTLAGWAASLPANLVTDGNSYEGDCYNDSEFSSSSNLLQLTGHTTDATHTIKLTTGAGQSFRDNANVQTNALNYNQANGVGIKCTGTYIFALDIRDSNTTISGLQINHTATSGDNSNPFYVNGGSNVLIENCIIKGATSSHNALRLDSLTSLVVRNCLVLNVSASGGGNPVLDNYNSTSSSFYFLTIVSASDAGAPTYGIKNTYGSGHVAKNCAVFGCTNFDNGAGSITYTTCMTDVASPPSGVTGSKTYASQFQNTTIASGDFREKTGADLRGAGTSDSTNGALDIAKTARPQAGNWDIGCWELLASGTAVAADAWAPIEFAAMQRVVPPLRVQFMLTEGADFGLLSEHLATKRADVGLALEAMATLRADPQTTFDFLAILASDLGWPVALGGGVARDTAGRFEWLAQVFIDRGLPVELGGRVASDTAARSEWLARAFADRDVGTEWLMPSLWRMSAPCEFTAALERSLPLPAECQSAIIALAIADAILPIEWSALPAAVRVSLERLLASPGKRRILGTPGRLRLLKGQ